MVLFLFRSIRQRRYCLDLEQTNERRRRYRYFRGGAKGTFYFKEIDQFQFTVYVRATALQFDLLKFTFPSNSRTFRLDFLFYLFFCVRLFHFRFGQ